MNYLNSIDYGVIGLYSAVLVGMALYLRRMATRSMEDYFLGGKGLPWWALGISGMSAFLDMTGTMVIVSFLYLMGPRGMYIEIRGGVVLILVFQMLWTGKWHYRSQVMTPAEWVVYRYGVSGGAKAARIITVVAGVMTNVCMLAYLIKGAGLFLSMFIPYSPMTCAVLMVVLTTLYTLTCGFYGVVYTDLFQSIIILLAVVAISIKAMMLVAGFDGNLAAFATSITTVPNWTSSLPSLHTSLPEGYTAYNGLFFVALIYLFRTCLGGMGTTGADPRYFGARNERECGKLTFFWTWLMVFRWPMMMGFAVLGLFLINDKFRNEEHVLPNAAQVIKYSPELLPKYGQVDEKTGERGIPKHLWEEAITEVTQTPERFPVLVGQLKSILETAPNDKWQEKVLMVGYEGIISPERVLPAVILCMIPAGLRGIFIVALVAAAMSTFSPTVNGTVALLTRDIWQGFVRPKAANRELMILNYVFGLALVGGGFLMAYTSTSINELWDWIIMGLGSGVVVPGILRLHWWRFNAAGANTATVFGLVAAVLKRAYETKVQMWCQSHLGCEMGPELTFFTVTAVSLVGAIIGTYLTAPTESKVLEHFYRTTRPFGLWRPLKKILAPNVRAVMEREHFYDIVSVPFAMMWQITLFLLPMQMIIMEWRSLAVTAVIFVISLAGLILLWWRNLPPDRPRELEVKGLEYVLAAEAAKEAPTVQPLISAGKSGR